MPLQRGYLNGGAGVENLAPELRSLRTWLRTTLVQFFEVKYSVDFPPRDLLYYGTSAQVMSYSAHRTDVAYGLEECSL